MPDWGKADSRGAAKGNSGGKKGYCQVEEKTLARIRHLNKKLLESRDKQQKGGRRGTRSTKGKVRAGAGEGSSHLRTD